MKIIKCPSLPLLIFLIALGLGLAFTSPAEARWERHRSYNSEFKCPVHGPRCRPELWGKDYRKDGRDRSTCAYYGRYYRDRNHGSYGQGRHWMNHH